MPFACSRSAGRDFVKPALIHWNNSAKLSRSGGRMIEHSPSGYRCQCGSYHGTHRHCRITLSALCPKCFDDLNRRTVEAESDLEIVSGATAISMLAVVHKGDDKTGDLRPISLHSVADIL